MNESDGASLRATGLRCEYFHNPLGIDERAPRLSWKLESPHHGVIQAGYRIIVSSTPARLAAEDADLWDLGRVASDRTTQIGYAGKPLVSRQLAYWMVQSWDTAGRNSSWSEPASWEMGLLDPVEWSARWIAGASHAKSGVTYFRRDFIATGPVSRARLYVTAHGVYRATINGEPVSDECLAPGWTDYRVRLPYQVYDITAILIGGANAVGVAVGEGWYAGPIAWLPNGVWGDRTELLAQLVITYADGREERVVTSEGWMSTESGPVVTSGLLDGEKIDNRLSMRGTVGKTPQTSVPGWDKPGFDDSAWSRVRVTDDPTSGVPLVARRDPPIRVTQELVATAMSEPQLGVFIFDFGQNISGWARLTLEGPAGTTITARHGEILNPDGTLYVANLRGAKAIDVFVLAGSGIETFEPCFTFHGFRYVELTGFPGRPELGSVTARVAHSDIPVVGEFECGNAMVNQLASNILWGQRGNFLSVPTDCPQRDERLGWMGDAQIFIRTATYFADVASFFTKWTQDVVDARTPDGQMPDFAPLALEGFAEGSPGWGDAGVICPWTLYEVYDDTRLLERCYPSMRAWVDFLDHENPDGLWINRRGNDFGDWLSIDADTSKDLLATAYFARSADIVRQAAAVLGRTDDVHRYSDLFAKVRDAFRTAYVKQDGSTEGDTQTGYVLPLRFNLLSENERDEASARLTADIERRGKRLSTGFHGAGHLNEVLTEVGAVTLAYDLLLQQEFPSWLYPIRHGATTIWERLDGWTAHSGFQDPAMNSFNHYAFGSIGEWLFHTVAGIDLDPRRPGFAGVVMRPRPDARLGFVNARYDSIHGPIISRWKIDHGKFQWTINLPANVTGRITVPGDPDTVTENGKHAGRADIEIGSGEAVFESIIG